jgi:predicted SAM-dependent methyltransferase
MHKEAREFVQAFRSNLAVCELGSYDVNGSLRDLFPGWTYVGVDRRSGPGVDVVADAATWDADGRKFDVVLCCEVLEHDPHGWKWIVSNAFFLLKPGGWFVVTAAGPGREPHSCHGTAMSSLQVPEPYANVGPEQLKQALTTAGFEGVCVTQVGVDVRAMARRPV